MSAAKVGEAVDLWVKVLADLERAAELEARYADTWQRRLGELDDMGIR